MQLASLTKQSSDKRKTLDALRNIKDLSQLEKYGLTPEEIESLRGVKQKGQKAEREDRKKMKEAIEDLE